MFQVNVNGKERNLAARTPEPRRTFYPQAAELWLWHNKPLQHEATDTTRFGDEIVLRPNPTCCRNRSDCIMKRRGVIPPQLASALSPIEGRSRCAHRAAPFDETSSIGGIAARILSHWPHILASQAAART
eukprot:770439-Amphidinium_carterae.1